jgi:branched-subunit amino acid ABC-type transport system permease component
VWQSSIAFGVLLLFIVFRPTGFFGRKIRTAKV